MKYAIKLLLMWFSPALIAGALGWHGIWGSGSAFFDYLIPIPVAGGALHVPSFIIAAVTIAGLQKRSTAQGTTIMLAALAVFVLAQSLQIDFARLNNWLFTDYAPAGSVLRFKANPLLLFIASDALWLAFFAWRRAGLPPLRNLLLLPLLPVLVLGTQALLQQSSGAQFKYGYALAGEKRGNQLTMVYTDSDFNEPLFRQWLQDSNTVGMPWHTPNAENLAVYFTRSMQAIKRHNMEDSSSIVATFCIYEEDRSMQAYYGFEDCFIGHPTLAEKLEKNYREPRSDLSKEINSWYARARLCEGVEIPQRISLDLELLSMCYYMKRDFPALLEKTVQDHGIDSQQAAFLREAASRSGLQDRD